MLKNHLLKSLILFALAGFCPRESKALQQTSDPIKIGLLIPDNKSIAAKQGAELAILHANQKAGQTGNHFILVIKTLEGPWGTGSKQAIDLIFFDKVSALMASCDGRNAHLIEQAATKSRVVLMSVRSGDPTLSQAFVPWFFNCAPNYNQQADAFIEEIYNKRKSGKIAVVSDNDYDSQLARDSFIKRSLLAGKDEPMKLSFNKNSDNSDSIVDLIKRTGVQTLLFSGNSKKAGRLIEKLKTLKSSVSIYKSLVLSDEEINSEKEFENVRFISTGTTTETEVFRNEYKKTYGTNPDIVAGLAYDGMNLLIEAIRSSGIDRENIQKALLKIRSEGVTGSIKFDEKGNRVGRFSMMQIKNGLPMPVEK
jgi:branched-chain amino acid transport system substrate-binding protein